MKKLIAAVMVMLAVSSLYAQDRPYTKVEKYFSGTDYELNVYRIYGRKDGPTMLILGGIQGNEPGGFLSADLYSGLQLAKGNLIVVPRANFKSVVLYDRGPDGDMNRRFQESRESLEMDKVVSVVKKLMGQADVFLNLHDGWGFHSPKDIDADRNHKRFGQSVITDANTYSCTNGRMLDLKTPAVTVLAAVNKKIDDDNYKLHYFDTATSDPDTQFKDMRKTATYYALRQFCIPAFGIEASKNLPSDELKVLYHNYAVNEFMHYYGIEPEYPAVLIQKPVMQYAVVMVNDEPVRVDRGSVLTVRPGDVCEVVHVETNYDRGVSADLIGYGSLNDMNVKYSIRNNSVVQFRKDSIKIGSININVSKNAELYAAGNAKPLSTASHTDVTAQLTVSAPAEQPATTAEAQPAETKPVQIEQPKQVTPVPAAVKTETDLTKGYVFIIKHNGKTVKVADGDTYTVKQGDRLVFVSINKDGGDMNLAVNLKGYYSPTDPLNSGDDRGYVIKMLPNKFMKKYATDDAKMTYPVIVKKDGAEIAKMSVSMQ